MITDNELYKVKFELINYAQDKANKIKIKNDYYWTISDEFSCMSTNPIAWMVEYNDHAAIRPVIRVSYQKFLDLCEKGKITYISKKDSAKKEMDDIRKYIEKMDADAEHSYEWALENLPGEHERTYYEKEDYIKALLEDGWHEDLVNKYFSL